ncbi:creatininase family protein [Ignicoccus hospitalis]|uniref:Creatininase n=1 Tax=Ignicoccus hospitalis (strain KIN4/I / DSM 18386 / JCM 14125) TaxID=453591 RepID=A8AAB9_IGNH4|nr:creatininase family protein [Ignicoccus hospitalis]ABU81871.1 Creatininase [Ignicoccus hospitalis KIN4/I]HIH90139.1 creatininase family protein [Desulfurococcaceae archaeon]
MGRVYDLAKVPMSRVERLDLVILPIGSIERHGNHLPLGTDTLIAEEVARRVAKKLSEKGYHVGLLPPIWYGYTWSLRHLDGTVSVEAENLAKFVEDILVTLPSPRIPRILIINGHGGNKEPLEVAVKEALNRLSPGIKIGAVSWWDMVPKEAFLQAFGTLPSHACEIETSMVMAICEECVDLGDVEPVPPAERKLLRSLSETRRAFSRGYMGDPKRAKKEEGERLLEVAAEELARRLLRELESEEEVGIE